MTAQIPPPSLPNVRQRLREIATGVLADADLAYTQDFRQELAGFLDRGADEMISQGRVSDPDFERARSNLVEFVAAVRGEMTTRGYAEAHEPTFYGAMSRLCPLWPFC